MTEQVVAVGCGQLQKLHMGVTASLSSIARYFICRREKGFMHATWVPRQICNQEALARKSVWMSAQLRSTSVGEVTDIFHYVSTSNWRLMVYTAPVAEGSRRAFARESNLKRLLTDIRLSGRIRRHESVVLTRKPSHSFTLEATELNLTLTTSAFHQCLPLVG
jgi:hypothetical protein